jgi:hypothetical protein
VYAGLVLALVALTLSSAVGVRRRDRVVRSFRLTRRI